MDDDVQNIEQKKETCVWIPVSEEEDLYVAAEIQTVFRTPSSKVRYNFFIVLCNMFS